MILLGLRLDDHDSNLCLYDNGQIKYIKTERVKKLKHHAYNNNWEWKLDVEKYFGISPQSIDQIAIVADPLKYNINQFTDFHHKSYDGIENAIQIEHHLAHALSGFMYGNTDCQIVIDGVGEIFYNNKVTSGTVWSVFKNYKLVDRNTSTFNIINQSNIQINNSIGVEYENIADFLGIKANHPNDLSGKLMSLQAYGQIDKNYLNFLLKNTHDVKKDLSLACHPKNWFDYLGSETVGRMKKLDFAATLHEYLYLQVEKIFETHASKTDKILYTGGCALNVCWNTRLKEKFPNLIIVPHCADDGLAFGALQFLLNKNHLTGQVQYYQTDESPQTSVSDETIQKTAKYLKQGNIVAWYQGNGEVGPRALGNRSILMDPTIIDGKDIINSKVKHREDYRPFGASILQEYQQDYFDIEYDNPYMLYIGKFKHPMPPISHIDNTCRFQSVSVDNKDFYKLIKEFYKQTNIPMLLNTSLNINGKPIAGSKRDALEILYGTDVDVLVYGDEIIAKEIK